MQSIEVDALEAMFNALTNRGFCVVGPTVSDGAIICDELSSPDQLPIGWTDEQDGAAYRLHQRSDSARFGYAVGPQSWKKYLHPPIMRLWRANRDGKSFQIEGETGSRAPILVTREMVQEMRPGSVIVDLAAEAGGNCELTRPWEEVEAHGVAILGPVNLPSTVPYRSSQMYASNLGSFRGADKRGADPHRPGGSNHSRHPGHP